MYWGDYLAIAIVLSVGSFLLGIIGPVIYMMERCCDVSSERHHQTGQKKLPTIENMGT